MKIKKNLLSNKPQEKTDIEVKLEEQNEYIKHLEQRLQVLEDSIPFLANFEKLLTEAISKEDDLLENASNITKNDTQKSIFRNIARSYNRILERVSNSTDFIINEQQMKIEKITKE